MHFLYLVAQQNFLFYFIMQTLFFQKTFKKRINKLVNY